MSEMRGRVYTIKRCVLIFIIFSFITFISWHYIIFAISLFLIGASLRGYFNTSIIYFYEISSENLRILGPVVFRMGWPLSIIFITLLSLLFPSWRIIVLVIAIIILVLALRMKFM